jgi:enoyl-CoA hydratase/carnithine racemase
MAGFPVHPPIVPDSGISLAILERVAHIRIARAAKRNALTHAMFVALEQALARVFDTGARVLVLSGVPGAFSAGADIVELAQQLEDAKQLAASGRQAQRTQLELERLPLPTIAAIDGVCVGGGLGLALACDLRIATPRSRFAITPAKLGLLYGVDDTRRLVNAVGVARAKEMLFTGRPVEAEEALAFGLVNAVVPEGELEWRIAQVLEQLLGSSRSACAGIKRTIAHIGGDPTVSRAELDLAFADAFGSSDFAEGARAFLEKREPEF